MPIRWKLVLWILAPLVVIYTAMLAIDYARAKGEAHAVLRARVAEDAASYAARFDARFEAVAQVARSAAAFLSAHPAMTEEQLYRLAASNVGQNPLVYGSCIAFEPGEYREGVRLFAPYVCRDDGPAPGDGPGRLGDGLRAIDIGRDSYDYTSGDWEWYTAARAAGAPVWTDPYFDEGAGNVLMCTYSAPFRRDGRFAGVATVDIRLEDLQRSMGFADAGGSEFGIVSRNGTFVSAPDPAAIMNETVFTLAGRSGSAELAEVGRRMIAGDRGTALMPGLPTQDGPVFIAYAPIASTGWSFAATIPEAWAMGPVYEAIRQQMALMLTGLAVIAAVLLLVAVRITHPIGRLAAAVRGLGAGNLDAPALRGTDITRGDELGDLARAFNTMTAELKTHVGALAAATAAREAVESELRIARAIQAALLPRVFPPYPDRTEFELHAVSAPARQVGGDFFDFFFVSDEVLTLVIADVSGKGIPAAMFMAVTRTLVRDLVMGGRAPGEGLTAANRVLLGNNDQGLFVTIFVGQYDTRTGVLRYANAGHPPPYRVDTAGGVHRFGEVTGTILGAIEDQTYAERSERLAPGERLVFYTDGVPEARAPSGEFFRAGRFEDLLWANRGGSAREICESALRTLDEFQANERHDDVTILTLHRRR